MVPIIPDTHEYKIVLVCCLIYALVYWYNVIQIKVWENIKTELENEHNDEKNKEILELNERINCLENDNNRLNEMKSILTLIEEYRREKKTDREMEKLILVVLLLGTRWLN